MLFSRILPILISLVLLPLFAWTQTFRVTELGIADGTNARPSLFFSSDPTKGASLISGSFVWRSSTTTDAGLVAWSRAASSANSVAGVQIWSDDSFTGILRLLSYSSGFAASNGVHAPAGGSIDSPFAGGLVVAATNSAGAIQFVTGGNAVSNRRWRIESSGGLTAAGSSNMFIEMPEQSSDPSAPAADKGRLFFKDNGAGKTQACIRFETGDPVCFATQP